MPNLIIKTHKTREIIVPEPLKEFLRFMTPHNKAPPRAPIIPPTGPRGDILTPRRAPFG